MTTEWESLPESLWRVSFEAPPSAMPGLLEALEEIGRAVSIFEAAVDEDQDPILWRVELLLEEKPGPAGLRKLLGPICAAHGFAFEKPVVDKVLQQDWVTATALRMPPILVGRFAVHGIHAAGQFPPGLIPVQVEAGLAFGSGEHQTTQACLEAIDRTARTLRYRDVLDMGCGSGVLAIAAVKARPGARAVAVDNDPLAVRMAAEACVVNDVAARIRCRVSEGFADPRLRPRYRFDLILANILADPLISMARDLAPTLRPGGRVVLSGFLDRQVPAVAAAFKAAGLRLAFRIDRAPWAALVFAAPARRIAGHRG